MAFKKGRRHVWPIKSLQNIWDTKSLTYLYDQFALKIFVCFKETQPKRQLPFHDLSCRSSDQRSGNCIFFKSGKKHFKLCMSWISVWIFIKTDRPRIYVCTETISKLKIVLKRNWCVDNYWAIWALIEGNHGISRTTYFTSLRAHYMYLYLLCISILFVLYLPDILPSSFSSTDCLWYRYT